MSAWSLGRHSAALLTAFHQGRFIAGFGVGSMSMLGKIGEFLRQNETFS